MIGQTRRSAHPLAAHVATVESILTAIGVNPPDARLDTDQGIGWSFLRGSATIEIYILEEGETGILQVLSPIVHLPMVGLLPLYRYLLELNLQLTNASLGIHLDTVYVFNQRPLEGMDANEANDIITQLAAYADELDNILVDEFGGRLFGQAS